MSLNQKRSHHRCEFAYSHLPHMGDEDKSDIILFWSSNIYIRFLFYFVIIEPSPPIRGKGMSASGTKYQTVLTPRFCL